jgi:hypothetical protein
LIDLRAQTVRYLYGYGVRCFKQIWKVGEVGKVAKVGKVGEVGKVGKEGWLRE